MPLSVNFTHPAAEKNITLEAKSKIDIGKSLFKDTRTGLFFLFIFVYQLIFIFQGLDLSDEGFLATYYQQIFKNPESVQYNFMFWLTGIIGGLYFKIFSFLGLWGLRLGGVLVTTGTAALTYALLKKYLNPSYLKLGLFLVVIALNNDIKELNYNNISALIYVTVVYYLFNGIKENSGKKILVSGMFVALNVFVRPPNILGLGLILAIFFSGYMIDKSLKLITKQALFFLTGFMIAAVTTLFIIYFSGHWNIFTNALQVVVKMGKGHQQTELRDSSYGIFRLLKQLKSNNGKSIFFTVGILISLILGISLLSTIKSKISAFHKIGRLIKYIFFLAFLFLITANIIDNYSILFFYSGIIVVVFVLSLTTPNDFDTKFLLFCGCIILISFPFGSSAGIITAGRYSFWIGLPISINYLFNIKSIKNQFVFVMDDINNFIQIGITENQIRILKNISLIILIFAGIYHSYFYPFFDKRNRIDMRYSIHNANLAGIYTTKGRAEAINELLFESSKYIKKGDYVLAYDCIPLYHFLTESVPYIRTAYPWLYETEIFKYELDLAVKQKKVLPVVVMQKIKTIGEGSKWPEETWPEDYSKWDVNQGRNKYMNEFLLQYHYREVWANQYFSILVPQ